MTSKEFEECITDEEFKKLWLTTSNIEIRNQYNISQSAISRRSSRLGLSGNKPPKGCPIETYEWLLQNKNFKWCIKCHLAKNRTFFSKCSSEKDGLQDFCAKCMSITARKNWIKKSPEERLIIYTQSKKNRDIRNKKDPEAYSRKIKEKNVGRYGRSLEWFEQTLLEQNYCCSICSNPFKSKQDTHIDHDHKCCPKKAQSCGRCVRGILCSNCNTGLGNFGDSLKSLFSAIKYLIKHRRNKGTYEFSLAQT